MIIEARYLGPYREINVPGFEFKTCLRGETVKFRVHEEAKLGKYWEIIGTETVTKKTTKKKPVAKGKKK